MSPEARPALTPEEWAARDYRQPARELDAWLAQRSDRRSTHDATELVAKLGLSDDRCVIAMNRAHDRVLVPPPARAVLAALALADEEFGFTRADSALLRRLAEATADAELAAGVRELAARLDALLPPTA